MYKKVEGHSGLVRDMKSGGIINKDTAAYQSYINEKNRRLREIQRIENLESEVGEIKDLLKQIINKL